MRAVRLHTQEKWVLLYIERWLKAPVQHRDGKLEDRDKGTPQGGVISPLLANLFLHYAFDKWMERHYPDTLFERYADDMVCHCRTGEEAAHLKCVLKERFSECRLALHQEKTKIVYCKDSERGCAYPISSFDFLGYTFRPRRAKAQTGKLFMGFNPAISNKAAKGIFAEVRSWKLHLRSDKSLEDLAGMFNAKIRGWINYYGAFYRSALNKLLWKIDCRLVRWAMRKCKILRNYKRLAVHWLKRIACKQPGLLAHWQNVIPKTG